MHFLTIPTAHSHPELLAGIIRDCSLPPEQIILVATRPDLDLPPGCVVIEDFGPPNIQRWWNLGIEEASHRGATAVAVLNDDLKIDLQTLPTLFAELERTNATIASPTRPDWGPGLYQDSNMLPYTPVIWGCLWVLNVQSDLRPDPSYVWWYGDSDLDIRARRDYSGIITADVYYEHYFPGEGTTSSKALQEQTNLDAATFEHNYKDLLRSSRKTGSRRVFLQTNQAAELPSVRTSYRTSFLEHVRKNGEPKRDRVVLFESDNDSAAQLRKLWSDWVNVLILPSPETNSTLNEGFPLKQFLSRITDGASLHTICVDGEMHPLTAIADEINGFPHIIVAIPGNEISTIKDTQLVAENLRLRFTGLAWTDTTTALVFRHKRPRKRRVWKIYG